MVVAHVELNLDIVGVPEANVITLSIWVKLNPRRGDTQFL